MGCKCKKQAEKIKKYADNREQLEQEEYELNHNIVNKVAKVISQVFFGILILALLIIVTVPLVFYVGGCVILGKQPYIKIQSPKSYFTKKDKPDGRNKQNH